MDITLHIPKEFERYYSNNKFVVGLNRLLSGVNGADEKELIEMLMNALHESKPVEGWIPVKWRDLDEEEREYYGDEVTVVSNFPLPDDGDEILVSVFGGKYVTDTVFCNDEYGVGDEYGYDWTSEVDAWMPLPKGYVKER